MDSEREELAKLLCRRAWEAPLMSFLAFLIGFCMAMSISVAAYRDLRDEAVHRGFAEVVPETGEWRWVEPKGTCDER